MPGAPDYERALAAHRAGRLEEAERAYLAVLARAPAHAGARHHLGVVQHQRGRHAEAERSIREALRLDPRDADAWGNLGAVLRALGQRGEACRAFEQALAANPAHASARANLGVVLAEMGRSAEAAEILRAENLAKPGQPAVLKHLGLASLRLGRAKEAAVCLQQAAALRPNDLALLNDCGVALSRCRDFTAAEALFRRVLAKDPDDVAALINLGDALTELGRPAEAEALLRRSIALDSGRAQARNNLGVALGKQARHAEAIAELREALRIEPSYVPAHHNLANELLADGNVAEGLEALRSALALDPDCIPAWYALATTGKHRFTPEEIARVEALLAQSGRPSSEQALLRFTLAQALEKGAPEQAFSHAVQANAIRRREWRERGLGYNPAAHSALVDALIETFTPALFERFAGAGSPSALPFFVFGMPRSGTTLIEQVLAAHPQVHAAGELNETAVLADQVPGFPRGLLTLPPERLRALAEQHLAFLEKLGGAAAHVVDKMTLNFLRLGFLALLYPRAKFIHARRDARDVALSCFFHNFAAPGLSFTFDLAELAHFYRAYERLMEHWRRVLPQPIHEVQYEEFVADPEPRTRALLDFCGLNWDDRCLSPHRATRRVKTASVLQVREPIYTRSIARWKPFAAQLEPFPRLSPPAPDQSEILAFAQAGRWEDALAACDRVLAFYPSHAGTLNNRGVVLSHLGRAEEAIAAQQAALAAEPGFAKAHSDLGLLYYQAQRHMEARAQFDAALAINPDHADALHNRGQMQVEDGNFDEGIAALRRALEAAPGNAETWNALGAALQSLGRVDEALAHYERAIACSPKHARARYNRASAWLLKGDFQRGWVEHESRLDRPDLRRVAQLAPRWKGEPAGTLLVVAEQGMGDTVQFIRYAPLARERAGRLIVAVQPELLPLMKGVRGPDEIVSKTDLPSFEACVPMLSLPLVLGGAIPAEVPYLQAPAHRVEHWRSRITRSGRPAVGINWQGNPKFPRDDLRSIPLKQFAPFADFADLHALHLGPGLSQLDDCGFPVCRLSEEFDTSLGMFVDTAAAMRALDLVITSDTSLAHLAGALGVPVWLIVSIAPDWRWRDQGSASSWYPSMRIFRQTRFRSWDEPIAEAAAALRSFSPPAAGG